VGFRLELELGYGISLRIYILVFSEMKNKSFFPIAFFIFFIYYLLDDPNNKLFKKKINLTNNYGK
jgi:hypothetical protein